jgi:hypothetical protein
MLFVVILAAYFGIKRHFTMGKHYKLCLPVLSPVSMLLSKRAYVIANVVGGLFRAAIIVHTWQLAESIMIMNRVMSLL